MPQNRPNQAQTPINADTFDLTGDLAKMADSLQVVITVADTAAADVIAAAREAAGFAITDARPMICWDQSQSALIIKGSSGGWRGGKKPFGHMAKTGGFQTCPGAPTKLTTEAAQILQGGMTYSDADDALVIPVTGLYRLTYQFYTTGTGGGTQLGFIYLNTTVQTGITSRPYKADNQDCQATCAGVMSLTAGDKVQMFGWNNGASVSCWGAATYSGCWLEAEYIGNGWGF